MSGFIFGGSGFGFSPPPPDAGGTVTTRTPRAYLSDFALANAIYAGAQVTIFTVDPVTLKATATLAPLYSDLVSSTRLANPQNLDGEGKWLQPVYVDGACIAVVSGAGDQAANVATGIDGIIQGFLGDWVSGRQYFPGALVRDGTAGNSTSGVYYCDTPHVSGVFGNDLAAGVWLKYVDAVAIQAGVVAATLTSAQNSATAAAAAQTAAGTSASAAATSATAAAGSQTAGATSATAAAASAVSALAVAGSNVGRNLLHNGQFRVQQRGPGPFTTNGAFPADRWKLAFNLDTGVTAEPVTPTSDVTKAAIGDEAANNYIWLFNTGNAGAAAYTNFAQAIEDVSRLSGKTVTVSFFASGGIGMQLGVSIDQYFGTGGSPSATVFGNGSLVAIPSTAWARHSVTFAVPSMAGKILGTNNDHSTNLLFWLSSGATNNTRAGGVGVQNASVHLWGVQLEIGSVATPLEKRDYATELLNCQRFLPAFGANARFMGQATGGTSGSIVIPFGTTRATVTGMTVSAASDFEVLTAVGAVTAPLSTMTFGVGSQNSAHINFTLPGGLVAGNATALIPANANARIYLTGAEL